MDDSSLHFQLSHTPPICLRWRFCCACFFPLVLKGVHHYCKYFHSALPIQVWVKTNGIPFWGCTGDWDVHWLAGIFTHGHTGRRVPATNAQRDCGSCTQTHVCGKWHHPLAPQQCDSICRDGLVVAPEEAGRIQCDALRRLASTCQKGCIWWP